MVLLLNDWAHVSRKFTQGEYAKCLHDRKENDGKIKAVEATHAADKSCIGKDKLKAAPTVFLNETLPIILTKAADTCELYAVDTVTHEGNAPVTGPVVAEARLLLGAKPAYLERPTAVVEGSESPSRIFIITGNTSDTQFKKMTDKRAREYEKYLGGDLGSKKDKLSYSEYEKLMEKTAANRVVASPVENIDKCNKWLQTAETSGLVCDDADQLYKLTCTCVDFMRGANRCACVVAVASELKLIDLEAMMDGAAPHARLNPGRPRSKTNWADKGSGSAKKRDAAWYLKSIESHKPMYYHRRKVAMVCIDNGDDVYWIGYVRNLKQPKAKAGSVAYIICFPDNPEAEDEQWSPVELATGLALADELGSAGTCPSSLPTSPRRGVPEAREEPSLPSDGCPTG
ncbi:phosphatidylinositol kinase [Aureococcus anophagefferens]|nr:phosphatidylinositol kinase [Aureococcus anophagefferens]